MQKNNLRLLKIISDSDISYLLSGVYVPLTMEGTILVDGILASCYSSVRHDLAHIGMTPYEMVSMEDGTDIWW